MSSLASRLVGRGVFNPDGSFVGRILAIKETTGAAGPTLLTKNSTETAVEIEWSMVAGGKDILVLKPGFVAKSAKSYALPLDATARTGWDVGGFSSAPKPPGEPPVCPTCGKKAKWIKTYGRWFCQNEKKYL